MRRTVLLLSVILLPALPLPGRADENAFDAWKNRPREPFSDADKSFKRARELLQEKYVDPALDEAELYRGAVAGMLEHAGGRPWDKLLSPAELAEMKVELSGEVVGIGVEIKFDADSGATSVLGVIPGAPAEKAGIAPGDRILKIDGRSFKGGDIRDVVYAMRGKAGTTVALTILRDDRIVDKSVVRAGVPWSPVTDLMLPDGVALVSIRAFNERTPQLLREALGRVAAGKARALVIDLRDDAGGLLDRMTDCASLLLGPGKTVATSVRRGGKEQAVVTAGAAAAVALPMAVLVNAETASGAELLAGALKHHAKARVVGKKTHGKWNVQVIEELPNRWAIKFTVGVFKSAAGELLDGKGLAPDIEVDLGEARMDKLSRMTDPAARLAADAQLRTAVSVLKLAP